MTTPTETTQQDPPADPPVDKSELAADILEKAGLSAEIVQRVRNNYRLQDVFGDEYGARRLRLIGEYDPDLAAGLASDMDDEIKSEAAEAEAKAAQERLDALDEDQRRIELARLDVEKAQAAQVEWEQENSRSIHDLVGELAATPNYKREEWWAGRSEAEVTALRDLEGVIPPVRLDWS